MPDTSQEIERQRGALRRRDSSLALLLLRRYLRLWGGLSAVLGDPVALRYYVTATLLEYVVWAAVRVQEQQLAFANQAIIDARALVGGSRRAVADLVPDLLGRIGGGSLEVFLAMVPQQGAQAVEGTTTVKEALAALDAPLLRVQTIARTEPFTVYREAARRFYETVGVEQWVWLASLDERTCAACWALHGTVHPMSETLDGHPACRCMMLPLLEGEENPIETGIEQFDEEPDAVQRSVLGRAGWTL